MNEPCLFLLCLFGTYWTLAFFFMACDGYTSHRGLLSRYKHQPHTDMDWNLYMHTVKKVLLDQIVFVGPVAYGITQVVQWRGNPTTISLPTDTNSLLMDSCYIFVQFVVITIVMDFSFYHVHRLLHTPMLYGRCHKQHHVWKKPVAVAAAYCTWVEQFFQNILPVVLGPILVNLNVYWFMIWVILSVSNGVITHSGYKLAFTNWYANSSDDNNRYHDLHHEKFTVNFGVFQFWDWWYGTLAV